MSLVDDLLRDCSEANHRVNLLMDGIASIAYQMGIIHKDAFISGPMALMLVDDIKGVLSTHGFKEVE